MGAMRRRTATVLAATLLAAGVAAAGCGHSDDSSALGTTGTPSPPATGAATPTATTGQPSTPAATDGGPQPTGSAAVARCHTSELAMTLDSIEPGAGQRVGTFTVRNTSGGDCTLQGYVGMQLIGASGDLPTTVVRDDAGGTPKVTLAPGRTTTFTAQWTVICDQRPPAATRIGIIPPDETTAITVDTASAAADGITVCGGQLHARAVGVTS